MKKIFKKLIPISTFTLMTLTSCAKQAKEEITTIKIVSDLDDITLMQNQTHTSKPVEVKCYDSNNNEIYMDFRLTLTINGNEQLPNWISITNKNEIYIDNPTEVGTYTFNVSAGNDQIHSLSKSFNVSVVPETHVIPESISIDIEDNFYCMYGEKTSLQTTVVPYKEGKSPEILVKECHFDIEVLNSAQTKDKLGNDLFSFSDSSIDPYLVVSPETDATYTGEYQLKINAYLLEKPSVSTTKLVTLYIDNVKEFKDENGNTYTRNNGHETWKLSKFPSRTEYLTVTSRLYQNKPVTKIDDYCCKNSNASNLVEVVLPESVDTIGAGGFAEQKMLADITMSGVKYVGDDAFLNDVVLELNSEAEQPSFITIGNRAFCCNYRLKINKLQDVRTIGEKAFIYNSLESFEIGENCTEIGSQAFCYGYSLKSFIIHTKKPPTLGGGAFTSDDALKTIKVPPESVNDYLAHEDWKDIKQTIEGI